MNPDIIRSEAEFSDTAYASYADQLGVNPVMFERYLHPRHRWDIRQFATLLLGECKGKRLLDYGCGMGEETIYFAKLGATVTSIDISVVGVEITKKRAAFNNVSHRVTALVMDAVPTEFPAESFDIVHGLGILHHVGLNEGLMEVRRVLKPGGKAVFIEWMGNSALVERFKKLAYGRQYELRKSEREEPLKWDECQKYQNDFSVLKTYPYHLTFRLRRLVPAISWKHYSERFDYQWLRLMPFLKHFAGGLVLYAEK